MADLRLAMPKLRLLLPRLASDQDGEVVATARALRRHLDRHGLDLHDLAGALETGAAGAEPTPADLARVCLGSGRVWPPHQRRFLDSVTRFGSAWAALTDRQAAYVRALHQRARCARGAA